MAEEQVHGVRATSLGASGAPQALIAERLRQTASAGIPSHFESTPPLSVEQWLLGDAGHLHRAFDLTALPVASNRRLGGPILRALKRTTRRLLFPVLDAQSSVNGANARVVSFLLRQLAAQARSIEELRRELTDLRAQRGE